MKAKMTFIDLFAGAGGLSEGFIRAGYEPIAHVEMDEAACYTLKTRAAYHYLKSVARSDEYIKYLSGETDRKKLYSVVPENIMSGVIHEALGPQNNAEIFRMIDRLLPEKKKVDLIIGGPPCQAYSLIGKSRDPKSMKWDKRKFLFRYYAEFLKRYRPEYFVFENVLGLLTEGNAPYLKEMIELYNSLGYSVAEPTVLNAEDYGVLQKRRRVIIIGRKGRAKFNFPTLESTENKWQTKRDLFYDLPFLRQGQEVFIGSYIAEPKEYTTRTHIRNGIDLVTQHITRKHNDRDLEIYSIAIDKWLNQKERLKYSDLPKKLRTHQNSNDFLDRYKVVDPFGHSHTMVAHIAKDGHYYIYPDEKNVRSISVREAARIQSFPDDYFFEGGRTASFKQIGNAVPPLMANAIAKSIKQKF
jgi:DNA (cytosine-5)-methyltransferase 1